MRRRIFLVAALVLAGAVALYALELASSKRDHFIERAGTLSEARSIETHIGASRSDTLRLVASSGLEIDMRVRRPAGEISSRLPAVILIGGQNTGKDAVDLVGHPDAIVFAAIDYPYAGGTVEGGFWPAIGAIPGIQDAFIDTPPGLSLALTWLLDQPWVDPERVELVGVSLGVPFAAAAGGVDKRFGRVWLIHGGADNLAWVRHAGRKAVPNELLRGFVARAALFLVYGQSFDTREWIAEIAPRPVIVVAARNDDFVPPEARAPFIAAATSDHVELIWTEGLHIQPKRTGELNQLLDIVLTRVASD